MTPCGVTPGPAPIPRAPSDPARLSCSHVRRGADGRGRGDPVPQLARALRGGRGLRLEGARGRGEAAVPGHPAVSSSWARLHGPDHSAAASPCPGTPSASALPPRCFSDPLQCAQHPEGGSAQHRVLLQKCKVLLQLPSPCSIHCIAACSTLQHPSSSELLLRWLLGLSQAKPQGAVPWMQPCTAQSKAQPRHELVHPGLGKPGEIRKEETSAGCLG